MSVPLLHLKPEHFGFEAARLLVPIDLRCCSPEVLEMASGLTRRSGAVVTLVHVLGPQVSSEADREAQTVWASRQMCELAANRLRRGTECRIRVRTGNPTAEIMREAVESEADLILLSARRKVFWSWPWRRPKGEVVRQVIQQAGCRVFVADAVAGEDRFRQASPSLGAGSLWSV
jgi:nucleotide-binding universal stress UspA family protein